VVRGGSWSSDVAGFLRCAYRIGSHPDSRVNVGHGFRCARTE
jgi:formylglycine-generating enzyme required for sulfatase activity